MSQPDFEQEFILETDASNQGLGAVLLQEDQGKKIPIAFGSKTLTETEKWYSITTKEMQSTETFECGSDLLSIDLNTFLRLISDSLNRISNPLVILLSDLKLKCSVLPNVDEINTVEQIYNHGIHIFDFFIYKYLKSKNIDKAFTVEKTKDLGSFPEYLQAIFSLFFISMTRGKTALNDNEVLPKFLSNYLNINLTYVKITKRLSSNPLSSLSHNWIQDINISELSKPVQQRLLSGIAGTRIFNVFKSYVPNNLSNVNISVVRIYNLVKDVANSGPFFEMHPFFIPTESSSISISKNLSNLLIEIFTAEELKDLTRHC